METTSIDALGRRRDRVSDTASHESVLARLVRERRPLPLDITFFAVYFELALRCEGRLVRPEGAVVEDHFAAR
jgi:hypothetical protein